MRSFGAHIGEFHYGVGHDFMLHRDVVVLVAGNLESRRLAYSARSGCSQAARIERGRWDNRPRRLLIVEQVEARSSIVGNGCGLNQRRITERVLLPDTIKQAVVENAVSRPDRRLAVPKRII